MTVGTMAVDSPAAPPGESRSFVDTLSGCVFYLTTPRARPDLWVGYLDGALAAYQHYDVAQALDYERTRLGDTTTVFFAAVDPAGRVVAGVRVQGPYRDVAEVESARAWSGRPGEELLSRELAQRIDLGLTEVRGVWIDRTCARRKLLGPAIARCMAHAPLVCAVPFGFGAVATFTVARAGSAGAVVLAGVPATAYPDQRYHTVPVLWDARRYSVLADSDQYDRMRADWVMLGVRRGAAERGSLR